MMVMVMILGESHILIGDKNKGTKLIKEGWVTADLSKNELKYFRKKYKKYPLWRIDILFSKKKYHDIFFVKDGG